eukprot:TRINITY_DN5645_c0_g1_i1.p1 TRINITY_DN5645_c0_g1~~TRINITY_DN5645_c0_g1_i1.p1  ORF type:complete len:518 (+),score=130.01 TRINITY_DN5645_c0_g1_i1:83-1555(+)
MEPPARQGPLTKLGYNSGKWQQRHFELKGSKLTYFSKAGGSEKGSILLNQACTVKAMGPDDVIQDSATAPGVAIAAPVGSDPCVELVAPFKGKGRAYYFKTTTAADRDAWVAVIAPLCGISGILGATPATGPTANAPGPAAGMGALSNMMGGLMGQGNAQAAPAPAAQPTGAPPTYTAAMASSAPATPSAPLSPTDALTPPPSASVPLPAIPAPSPTSNPAAMGMGGMLKMAMNLQSAMLAHQNDPHLSKTDNAAALGQKVSAASGQAGAQQAMVAFLEEIQATHLPKDAAGFIVTEVPAAGTLAQAYGIKPYDFVYAMEGQRLTTAVGPPQFGEAKTKAFATRGCFTIWVYNFQDQSSRAVDIMMPAGKPNAVLGMVSSQLPLQKRQAMPPGTLFCKGWRKTGVGYMSTNEYFPLAAPFEGTDGDGIYIKAHMEVQPGMMMSQNDYFPLYGYAGPALLNGHQVCVEAYSSPSPGMYISVPNKYAPLPTR